MRYTQVVALCLLFLAGLPAAAHDLTVGNLLFDHPWIAETPPGSPAAAGYVVISNNGDEADRLLSVTSDVTDRTEVHSMTINDAGVMEMRAVTDGLAVEPGTDLKLEPGGYHLMFMGLTDRLTAGEHYTVIFTFERAGDVALEFVVEKRPSAMDHRERDHDAHDDH
ncbi:MAG: copper chaperone PCu(A)C [Rhodospirillales bacterium]|nr:copper chaperone PCu(A)C [Rhodospirillales bacterium]